MTSIYTLVHSSGDLYYIVLNFSNPATPVNDIHDCFLAHKLGVVRDIRKSNSSRDLYSYYIQYIN